MPGARVWDLGANTGRFSRSAADAGKRVVAFDIDPAAAERHFRAVREAGRTDILPLVVDIANPSPAIGWAGRERRSLLERADADAILALALVHHLALTRNVPLPMLFDLFADLAPWAIVEFVAKDRPMVAAAPLDATPTNRGEHPLGSRAPPAPPPDRPRRKKPH